MKQELEVLFNTDGCIHLRDKICDIHFSHYLNVNTFISSIINYLYHAVIGI